MAKIIIPQSYFDIKFGRVVYPWKYRKDKTHKSPFSNSENTYELVFNNKVKTLNFGDDLWKCTGISTDLLLRCPNTNLINIDIKSTTNHPYGFDGYDFVYIKNWTIQGNEIIFCMKPEGKEGRTIFNKWNSTSSNLENLNLDCTGTKVIISGQNSLQNIKITSPDKTLSTLNLSVERCQSMKMIDLSEIELIKFRGLEHFYKVDENIKYKFNPNLKIGLSSLHKWANYDRYSPFKYSIENLNDEFKTWDETGKIISLKDIYPELENNPVISVKELKQKINEFLLNRVYSKPYAFKIQQEFEKQKDYKPALNDQNQKEYKEWLKQEEIRKEQEEKLFQEKRKQWEAEEKIRKAEEAIQKAKEAQERKIAYEKKVKEFYEKVKNLEPIQQAYLETLLEKDHFFQHWLEHQSPFEYINNPKLLKEIDSLEKIKKLLNAAVKAESNFWSDSKDGSFGRATADAENGRDDILKTIKQKLKLIAAQKIK